MSDNTFQMRLELINELFTEGLISEEQVILLQQPSSVTIVTDVKNWLKSLDETIVYDGDN